MGCPNIYVSLSNKAIYIYIQLGETEKLNTNGLFFLSDELSTRETNYWLNNLHVNQVLNELSMVKIRGFGPLIKGVGELLREPSFGFYGPVTTTVTGHESEDVLSALNEYINKGMTLEAEAAAFELFRSKCPLRKKPWIILYNGLASISARSIGLANLPLVLATIEHSTEMLAEVLTKGNPAMLATLIQLLSQSEKELTSDEMLTKGREHFSWSRTTTREEMWETLEQHLPKDVFSILHKIDGDVFLELAISIVLSNACGECKPYDYTQDVEIWKSTPLLQDLITGNFNLII